MRIIGLVLVILGALGLGWGGLSAAGDGGPLPETPAHAASAQHAKRESLHVSPVFGGIALVSGLILIVTGTRRD